MTQSATLTISTPPPSVNNMHHVSGRQKRTSAEARAWKSMAAWELKQQVGISGPCYWSAEILIPGDSTKADLDNLSKGILDALGDAGKTPDDRYLVGLSLRFYMGQTVQVSVHQEDAMRWGEVRRASKALIKKLSAVFREKIKE